jgi:hypothetical protein
VSAEQAVRPRAPGLRLPDFLVIGAAKCGTTTLCALLDRHPDVYVHPRKELNFFSHDDGYARGLAWYAQQFATAGAAAVIGEGSPNYTKLSLHPDAAPRIARALPHAKLIYVVRHPLRRMESAWLHARRSGHRSSASFTRTVRRQRSYVDTSDYGRQLAAYQRLFADDQILVVFLDDLESDPKGVLARCFEFLGVDPGIEIAATGERRNPSSGRRIDRAIWHAAKRFGGVRAFDRFASKRSRSWRWLRKRWLQRRVSERPEWDAETLAWVTERLAEPTARFLESQGRSPTLWRF